MAKGASEAIMKGCTQYATYTPAGYANKTSSYYLLSNFINRQMAFRPMDETVMAKIEEQGSLMASQGLRVIALAIRPVTKETAEDLKQRNEASLAEVFILFIFLYYII